MVMAVGNDADFQETPPVGDTYKRYVARYRYADCA